MGVSITVYDSADKESLKNEIERAWDCGEFPSGQILKLFFSHEEISDFVNLLNEIYETTVFDKFYMLHETEELTDGKEFFDIFDVTGEVSYPSGIKYAKFKEDYTLLTLLEVSHPVIIIQ